MPVQPARARIAGRDLFGHVASSDSEPGLPSLCLGVTTDALWVSMILDGATITLDMVAVNRVPETMSDDAHPEPAGPALAAERLAAAEDVCTPALLLDVAALRRNLERMERLLAGKARLRPHAKTHKSPDIARLQMEAGAIGITTATVWEALALAEAGLPDILIANEVV